MCKKKLLGIILAGSLISPLFFCGCGGSETALPDTSLTIWGMGIEGERLKDVVDMFQEENPDIEIAIQAIPWGQAHAKIITAVAGGGKLTPDVCQFGTTWVPEFVSLEALENLDKYIQASAVISKEKYFGGSWDTGVIEDKVYGIPWYVDTRVLFYRKDILEKAGFAHPPRTWEELKAICRKLVVKGEDGKHQRYGISLPPADAKTMLMFMWSNGGEVLSPEGEIIIDSPENEEAWEFYTGLIKEGLAPATSSGGTGLYNNFKTGYTPMFIGGPWMLKDLQTHVPEIAGKWDVALLPMKKSATSFVGGSDWVIFKNSRNKNAAWKFIEFMSRPDIQIQWYQLTTDLPTRIEAWEDKFFDDKKMVKTFGRQLFDTKTPPRIHKWEELDGEITLKMEKVVFNKLTSQEALAQLKIKLQRLLSQRR